MEKTNTILYEIKQSAKAADGRNISIKAEAYEDKFCDVDGQPQHLRITFIDTGKDEKLFSLFFGKEQEANVKMALNDFANNIDQMLDVNSKR